MKTPAPVPYNAIAVGDTFEFRRTFTPHDERRFAALTGDRSVLTLGEMRIAVRSKRNRRIVHGVLAASVFGTLIDCHIAGPRSLYLSQTLHFKHPVVYGESVTVRGTVIGKNESIRLLSLRTEVVYKNKILLSGEAKVQILGDR